MNSILLCATVSAVTRYVTLGNVSCNLSRRGVARAARQVAPRVPQTDAISEIVLEKTTVFETKKYERNFEKKLFILF